MGMPIWTWSLLVLDICLESGPLSNMDHPLLPKIEIIQLVMPNWALEPFDSSNCSNRTVVEAL